MAAVLAGAFVTHGFRLLASWDLATNWAVNSLAGNRLAIFRLADSLVKYLTVAMYLAFASARNHKRMLRPGHLAAHRGMVGARNLVRECDGEEKGENTE